MGVSFTSHCIKQYDSHIHTDTLFFHQFSNPLLSTINSVLLLFQFKRDDWVLRNVPGSPDGGHVHLGHILLFRGEWTSHRNHFAAAHHCLHPLINTNIFFPLLTKDMLPVVVIMGWLI